MSRKIDIANIAPGESINSLVSFIRGKRSLDTSWCNWKIPIHWGGLSDPFQPVERKEKRSIKALEVFAESGYPFVVSTKSDLIKEDPYFSLFAQCNAVIQFSACSERFDKIERGASTYSERIRAAEKLARIRRVNIRIQPFIPLIAKDILDAIPKYSQIGIHGIIIEGMKYTRPKIEGLVQSGKDFVYPIETLLRYFEPIKEKAHKYGLKFYCAENRLRKLSDELCCCGIEGMGWKENKANVNHFLFDNSSFVFDDKMKERGTAVCFLAAHQDTLSRIILKEKSFEDAMKEEAKRPYMFMTTTGALCRFSESDAIKLREYLRNALKQSGKGRKDVDIHLGTNGMAGHYFGESQWAFPTQDAYDKMREIIPLPPVEELFRQFGIKFQKRRIFGYSGRI